MTTSSAPTARRAKKAKLSREKRRNIRKWVNALRSGEYQQADGVLRSVNEDDTAAFCCLGVLCDVMGTPIPDGWQEGSPFISEAMIHPIQLDKWTGLDQTPASATHFEDGEEIIPIGDLDDEGYAGYLANRNDNGWSFRKIADTIERRAEAIHPGWREGL